MSLNLTSNLVRIVAVGVVLTGCASGPDIRSDYDRDANFGAYKTYNFMARENEGRYQSLFDQYMVAAIEREMEGRGYVKSDNPDLLVNFNAILQDRTEISQRPSTTPMYGGYYGYRRGYYNAWGGYGYGTETHVSQYTEGTFNIDLVDAAEKRLVWEGVAIGRVTESAVENLEERINTNVPLFFEQYPFIAGDPSPRPAAE